MAARAEAFSLPVEDQEKLIRAALDGMCLCAHWFMLTDAERYRAQRRSAHTARTPSFASAPHSSRPTGASFKAPTSRTRPMVRHVSFTRSIATLRLPLRRDNLRRAHRDCKSRRASRLCARPRNRISSRRRATASSRSPPLLSLRALVRLSTASIVDI
jgi:hypothetical protein